MYVCYLFLGIIVIWEWVNNDTLGTRRIFIIIIRYCYFLLFSVILHTSTP